MSLDELDWLDWSCDKDSMLALLYAVAILRDGLGGSWLPRFLTGPQFGRPGFVLTFNFVWFTYTADNFQPKMF